MVRDAVWSAGSIQAGGYTVTHTGSPAEALSLIEQEAFDLLLTDVVMPEMLGTELGVRIAEMRPDLPILYMSGYIDPSSARATRPPTPS